MKNCKDCASAEWSKTASGRLHPSGAGKCRKAIDWKAPPIPACSYWHGEPKPYGASINRRKELKDHCVYWAKKEAA